MTLRITFLAAAVVGLIPSLGLLSTGLSVATSSRPQSNKIASQSEMKWLTNMSAAMKQARAENKDLLLNFTGSDWCEWCKVLNDEVFASNEFRRTIPQRFVLVTLDFPAGPDKQNPRLAKQNHTWLEKLAVDGFPTVALCDADGRLFASHGYEDDGAKSYVAMLVKDHQVRVARDRAMAEAKGKSGLTRAKLLDDALRGMDDAVIAQHYTDEVAEVLKLAGSDRQLTTRYREIELVGKQRAALAELRTMLAGPENQDAVLKRLGEIDKLFDKPSELREQFLMGQLGVLDAVGCHQQVVDVASKLLASETASAASLARGMLLGSLVELGEFQSVIEKLAEWGDLAENERWMLSHYQVEALLGMERTDEAVELAKAVIRKSERIVGDPFTEWFRIVVEKKGNAPGFEDFVSERFQRRFSEFWIGLTVVPGEDGFEVESVASEAPAATAGLLEGDVVAAVDGVPMKSLNVLLDAIDAAGTAKSIALKIRRDRQELAIDVQPERRQGLVMGVEPGFELAAIPKAWVRSFEDALRQAKADEQEVVLYFSAKWCGPCQVMLRESFSDAKVTKALSERVVAYMDLDSDGGAVADRYGIQAVPTMLFLDAAGKELGRATGFHDAGELLQAIDERGPIAELGAADTDGDGRVQAREFRKYLKVRVAGDLPFGRIFRELDRDGDGSLDEPEFSNRFAAMQAFAAPPVERVFPDPGADFVPYRGGATAVDDARIFGAVIHRYQELLQETDWPQFEAGVPETVAVPDLSSAKPCKSADDLARATLIIAGGDVETGDFFTAGAVLVSSDGLAITNYHVVEGLPKSKLAAMDSTGSMHRVVEVLAGNSERDVALVRVEGDGFNAVKIAASPPVAGADLVMMHHSEMRFFTYDRGYVMRHAKIGDHSWMEISAPYAPGGSGCGIYNSQRELVGIVSTITVGDGPDLAMDAAAADEPTGVGVGLDRRGSHPEFGQLVVRHAVPWSAIQGLWKK